MACSTPGPALGWTRRWVEPAPSAGRRLSAVPKATSSTLCNGAATMTMLQTTLRDVLINFSLFDERAAVDLWSTRPLLGRPRPCALRLTCSDADLDELSRAYEGTHLQPLIEATRGRKRVNRSVQLSGVVAVLVLADYPNFFHQMGSVVAAYAALVEAGLDGLDASQIQVYLLGNANIQPT